jgi:hypothetical protein
MRGETDPDGGYPGPARLHPPCTCGSGLPIEYLAEHPEQPRKVRELPPLYLCRRCRATYTAYFSVEEVQVRRLVFVEGKR